MVFLLFFPGFLTECDLELWSFKGGSVFLAVIILLVVVGGSWFVFGVDGSTRVEARSVIVDAEEAIVDCYKVVADADEAGANVSVLLATLEESGWLLSRAKVAYQSGDYGFAIQYAVQSMDGLSGVIAGAEDLKKIAEEQSYWDFMVNIVGSLVGAGIVVLGGFIAWFLLKKRVARSVA